MVITHLHYDHAGNLDLFPKARFHLQDREMGFATGRHMCQSCLRYPFEVEDVVRMVRVMTERGPIVLASDASHYYANMDEQNPFPIVYDLGAMAQGWGKARRLAGHEDRIIPGHDPKVRTLYPAHPGSDGETVALHLAPTRSR